jgi:GntR family transcriptional regulator
MLESLGYSPRTRVLDVCAAGASAEEAAALGIKKGADIVRLTRLREADEVLIYSVNAFAASLLDGAEPSTDDFDGSLNDWLAARGRAPHSSAAQIRAVELPPDAEDRDELRGLGPWLLITERCVDGDGEPVLYSRDYHRGDVFTFHVLRRRST